MVTRATEQNFLKRRCTTSPGTSNLGIIHALGENKKVEDIQEVGHLCHVSWGWVRVQQRLGRFALVRRNTELEFILFDLLQGKEDEA